MGTEDGSADRKTARDVGFHNSTSDRCSGRANGYLSLPLFEGNLSECARHPTVYLFPNDLCQLSRIVILLIRQRLKCPSASHPIGCKERSRKASSARSAAQL